MDGQQLILMTPSEFDRLAVNVRQQIQDEFVALKSHLVERPLTKKEAATYLGVTYKTVESRILTGAIPSKYVHKNGGTIYFFASELKQLIKES